MTAIYALMRFNSRIRTCAVNTCGFYFYVCYVCPASVFAYSFPLYSILNTSLQMRHLQRSFVSYIQFCYIQICIYRVIRAIFARDSVTDVLCHSGALFLINIKTMMLENVYI